MTRLRDARLLENLTGAAAETWCLDQMEVSTLGVAQDTPLWLKLDIRVEENRGRRGLPAIEPGLNLTRLIELFSQPRPSRQTGWLLEAGPFSLKDLRRTNGGRGPG